MGRREWNGAERGTGADDGDVRHVAATANRAVVREGGVKLRLVLSGTRRTHQLRVRCDATQSGRKRERGDGKTDKSKGEKKAEKRKARKQGAPCAESSDARRMSSSSSGNLVARAFANALRE